MSSVTSVLLRRSAELTRSVLQYREQAQILGWLGPLIVILTTVTFGLAIIWVEYTCGNVIATLAAIEDTSPTTYARLEGDDSNDPNQPNDLEVAAKPNTKPITRGLRSALTYLRARGGIRSTFRGLRMYIAFTGLDLGVGLLIRLPTKSLFGAFLGEFAARMLLATWQMAWVHLVIADKSPRTSYRRMLGLRHWRSIAPAVALYNGIMTLVFSLPWVVYFAAGYTIRSITTDPLQEGLLLSVAITSLLVLIFLLVSSLARAVFIRVAASMLPEEDIPIVPFDRLFGGRTRPEATGGSSKLGLMDAWTSFQRPACVRFLKVIFKTLAIEIALAVGGVLLVQGELYLMTPRS